MAINEVGIRLNLEGAQNVNVNINQIIRGVDGLGESSRRASSGADMLKNALAGMATIGTVAALVKMADSVTTLQTQLRLSSKSATEAGVAFNALFAIAQQGRVSFTELGTTYAAIARAGNEMGVSQSRLLAVTQSISQAMTIGGGSAASMQAALVQLGQGLSSGVLRGEELNSIMEQTPRLAKAIADGLGVPIGKLRELGAAGELTAKQVISALEKSGPQLAKEMESATLTVGQAFTVLGNSTAKFIGEADKASGASNALAGALKNASGAIDTVGDAIKRNETAFNMIAYGLAGPATLAGIYSLAAAISTRLIPALATAAAAAGPIGLIALAITAVGGAAVAAGNAWANSAEGMRASSAKMANEIKAIDAALVSGLNGSGRKADVGDIASMQARRKILADKKALLQQEMALSSPVDTKAEDARLDRLTATYKHGQEALEAFNKAGEHYLSKSAKNQAILNKEIEIARAALDAGKINASDYAARIKDVQASFAKSDTSAAKAAKQAIKEDALELTQQINLLKLAQANADKEFANTDAIDKRNQALRGYATELEIAADYENALAKGNAQLGIDVRGLLKTRDTTLNDKDASAAAKASAADAYEQAVQLLVVRKDIADVAAKNAAIDAGASSTAKQTIRAAEQEKVARERANAAYTDAYNITQAQGDLSRAGLKLTVEQSSELLKQETIERAKYDQSLAYQSAYIAYLATIADIESKGGTDANLINQRKMEAGKELAAARAAAESSADSKITVAGLKAATTVKTEWQKTADTIQNSLTDAFMGAIDNGKSLFVNLRDSIVGMFKNMVLRPTVQAFVGDVMGAVGLGGGASGASGIAGAVNTASSLNTLYGAGSQALFGASAGASGASLAFGNAVGMAGGDALGAMIAANGSWAGVASGTTAAAAAGSAAAGSAAAGSSLTSAMAAIPGWGWTLAGGLALAAIFGGSDGPDLVATGSSNRKFDRTGKLIEDNPYEPYGGNTAGITKTITNMEDGYLKAANALGINTVESTFGSASSVMSDGSDPKFGIYAKAGDKTFQSGEQAYSEAAMSLAASRAVFTALQASEMPKYLSGVFDGITASTATQEQIDAALTGATALSNFNKELQNLPFTKLADLSFAATQSLIGFAGGLDTLKANLGTYYTNFYSEEQQRAQTITNINKAIAGSGIDAATATRDSFREVVEAQDLTTESGQKMYAALLSVSGSMAGLITASESAAKAVTDQATATAKVAEEASKAAAEASKAAAELKGSWQDKLDVLTGSTTQWSIDLRDALATTTDDATRQIIQRVFDLQKPAVGDANSGGEIAQTIESTSTTQNTFLQDIATAVSKVETATRESISALTEQITAVRANTAQTVSGLTSQSDTYARVADSMKSLMDSILGTTSAISPEAKLAAQRADFESIASKALAGDVSAAEQLPTAASALLDTSSKYSATSASYNYDQARAYAVASTVRDSAMGQASNYGSQASSVAASGYATAKALEQQLADMQKLAETEATASEWYKKWQHDKTTNPDVFASFADPIKSGSPFYSIVKDYAEKYNLPQIFPEDEVSAYVAQNAYNDTAAQYGYDPRIADVISYRNKNMAFLEQSSDPQSNLQDIRSDPIYPHLSSLARQFGIPFFSSGTDYLPSDQLAYVHKGEQIVPAAYNPNNPNNSRSDAALLTEITLLRAEVSALRTEARATAINTRKIADLTDTATEGGRAMQTEVYA